MSSIVCERAVVDAPVKKFDWSYNVVIFCVRSLDVNWGLQITVRDFVAILPTLRAWNTSVH